MGSWAKKEVQFTLVLYGTKKKREPEEGGRDVRGFTNREGIVTRKKRLKEIERYKRAKRG